MGSSTAPNHRYTVIRVPAKSPRLTEIVTKFRDTKLTALKLEPEVFVQRYDLEVLHPVSVWQGRLSRQTTLLVCVVDADDSVSPEDALLQKEWAGFAAVRGPMTMEDYYHPPEMRHPMAEHPESETRWHYSDLYTIPAHRKRGVAMKLNKSRLAVATSGTRALGDTSKTQARLRLFVNPKRTWLVDFDRKVGFHDSHMVTLKEGLTANGMEESVPDDTQSTPELRALWETRYGLAMEQVITVN
ncbi:hypothetical protein BKA63DRAFT_188304 [Paraphoma chrysanthemicola]|nr:hypothetical protein BKA63DRAFT_188304 [Paraphoma chrysanthemicola]